MVSSIQPPYCINSIYRVSIDFFFNNVSENCLCPGKKAATVEIKRKLFANKAHNETVETGVVKFDAEEAAEVAILSRDCMRHLGDWYYPEGGWGWVVVTMTLITSVLSSGMLMGGGNIMVSSINKRLDLFKRPPMFRMYLYLGLLPTMVFR